jgi:hypothetical protein
MLHSKLTENFPHIFVASCKYACKHLDGQDVAEALVTTQLKVFAKSRWCTSGDTAADLMLLCLCHNVLHRAVPIWLEKQGFDCQTPIWEDLGEIMLENMEGEAYWAAFNEKQRGSALKFARAPTTTISVALWHKCLLPNIRLMDRFLREGGGDWDRCELQSAAMGQPRAFRITEACTGKTTEAFFKEVRTFIFEHSEWEFLPTKCCTQMEQSLAFGMLIRTLGGIHFHIASVFAAYPYRLWLLVDSHTPLDSAVDAIWADPSCSWDPFTVDFRRHYDSKEKLRSPECRSLLFALAILLRLDTSRVESRHAWLRRLLRVKGQTWVHELAQASADWVLLRERIIEGLDHRFVESNDKEQNDEDGIAPGGGSCRAFLSKWLPEHPMQGFEDRGAWLRAGHLAYFDMVRQGGGGLDMYMRSGKAGAIAHRAGGHSFGRHHQPSCEVVSAESAKLDAWQIACAEEDSAGVVAQFQVIECVSTPMKAANWARGLADEHMYDSPTGYASKGVHVQLYNKQSQSGFGSPCFETFEWIGYAFMLRSIRQHMVVPMSCLDVTVMIEVSHILVGH